MPEIDYTKLSDAELSAACGADADKWAEFACQIGDSVGVYVSREYERKRAARIIAGVRIAEAQGAT